MENASKALLFAAGILIAIILISVAVYIVSMSNNATQGVASTMTEMELSSFNSKFTTYEGKTISGSQVKQLVETVNASNLANAGTDLIVIISGDGIDGEGSTDYKFKGGTAIRYSISMTKPSGAVKEITVNEIGKTKTTPKPDTDGK